MKTIIDMNKLIIDADRAIIFICFRLEIRLLLYDVEIRNIPIKGTNNKSVSNIYKYLN